MPIIEKKRKMG